MHELALTENILSIALSEAKKKEAQRVKKIKIDIGEMTAVAGECICFYFEIVSKDTIAEGAEIEIKNLPVKSKCPQCSKIYQVKDLDFTCPDCGSLSLEIVSGKELLVSSIDIE